MHRHSARDRAAGQVDTDRIVNEIMIALHGA